MDSLNILDRGWGEREGDREIPYCESLTVWAAGAQQRARHTSNWERAEAETAQQVGRLIPRESARVFDPLRNRIKKKKIQNKKVEKIDF